MKQIIDINLAGDYVQDVALLVQAATVSGLNVVLVGEPGWGKTDAMKALTDAIWGQDAVAFVEITPALEPARITGRLDVPAALNGQIRYDVTGTPYDPNVRAVILDEFSRANSAVEDALLHATEPKRSERKPFFGTANWTIKTRRQSALASRFPLVYFMPETIEDLGGAEAVLGAEVFAQTIEIYTAEALEDTAFDNNPISEAEIAPWTDRLAMLAKTVTAAELIVSPRLMRQWQKVAVACERLWPGDNGALLTVLGTCYPAVEREQAETFRQAVETVMQGEEIALTREMLRRFRARLAAGGVSSTELQAEIEGVQQFCARLKDRALAARTEAEMKAIVSAYLKGAL